MKSAGATRRALIRKSSLALAAGPIALSPFLAGSARKAKAAETEDSVKLAPKYYPLESFDPELDLRGKLAVITGASRGLGRAILTPHQQQEARKRLDVGETQRSVAAATMSVKARFRG